MENQRLYRAEDFTVELDVEEYIARFRDAERVGGYCRACHNYGRSWGCPPFDFDVEEQLRRYRRALIVATRITPAVEGLPFSRSGELLLPERRRLEGRLLEMERCYGGRAYSYIGTCLYCPAESCTRLQGLPCRHPDRVRPSLEACGFDIGRTTEELFGLPLKWSRDGVMPEYLILVCGFLHNAESVEWEKRDGDE